MSPAWPTQAAGESSSRTTAALKNSVITGSASSARPDLMAAVTMSRADWLLTGPDRRGAYTGPSRGEGCVSEDDWRRWVPEAAQRYLPRPDADWTKFVPPEWRSWLDASPAPRPQTPTLRFIAV